MSDRSWEWTSPYWPPHDRWALDDFRRQEAGWKSIAQQQCSSVGLHQITKPIIAEYIAKIRASQQLDAAAANLNRLSKEGF